RSAAAVQRIFERRQLAEQPVGVQPQVAPDAVLFKLILGGDQGGEARRVVVNRAAECADELEAAISGVATRHQRGDVPTFGGSATGTSRSVRSGAVRQLRGCECAAEAPESPISRSTVRVGGGFGQVVRIRFGPSATSRA